jgi:hypothetical protein
VVLVDKRRWVRPFLSAWLFATTLKHATRFEFFFGGRKIEHEDDVKHADN